MDRFPDYDIDEEPRRAMCRAVDEPDIPTREEILQEAMEFHDDWSRQNPNQVYGH